MWLFGSYLIYLPNPLWLSQIVIIVLAKLVKWSLYKLFRANDQILFLPCLACFNLFIFNLCKYFYELNLTLWSIDYLHGLDTSAIENPFIDSFEWSSLESIKKRDNLRRMKNQSDTERHTLYNGVQLRCNAYYISTIWVGLL